MTTLNNTTRTRTSLVVLYSHNYAAAISGHYQESSDCFEYPKNPYLNQATQKNT